MSASSNLRRKIGSLLRGKVKREPPLDLEMFVNEQLAAEDEVRARHLPKDEEDKELERLDEEASSRFGKFRHPFAILDDVSSKEDLERGSSGSLRY